VERPEVQSRDTVSGGGWAAAGGLLGVARDWVGPGDGTGACGPLGLTAVPLVLVRARS
jgi:hypothetical protein